jgi:hypothetical protein
MAVIDDLRQAVTDAISAGSAAARAQGTALTGDFENLVKPQLDDILVQVAAITEDFTAGTILKDQAQGDLTEQRNRIVPVILGVAELSLLAVQTIINAVMDALKTSVNTAAGVALL